MTRLDFWIQQHDNKISYLRKKLCMKMKDLVERLEIEMKEICEENHRPDKNGIIQEDGQSIDELARDINQAYETLNVLLDIKKETK